jgi:hypothetical protein
MFVNRRSGYSVWLVGHLNAAEDRHGVDLQHWACSGSGAGTLRVRCPIGPEGDISHGKGVKPA